MGFFDKIFSKKETSEKKSDVSFVNPIQVELHSHLIHAVDDGVQTLDESLEVFKIFKSMGYKKVITTPHIMSDFYKNGAENLLPKLEELKEHLLKNELEFEVEVAAEYMIDDGLSNKIKNKEILSFGGNKKYVLVELPFLSEPYNFKNLIFDLQIAGYTPVLAHPERYSYFHNQKEKYHEFFENGMLMQINNLSLIGYYNPIVQKIAEYLIDKKLHSFVGSDAHNARHAALINDKVISSKLYQKACSTALLNNKL